MAALSAPRSTKALVGDPLPPLVDYPQKGSTTIYQGSLVVLAAGYLKPGVTGTGLLCVGMAEKGSVNSGADGAVIVAVRPGVHRWANSANADAIAQADVGTLCYVVDDQTVAKTDGTGTRSIAGTIAAVDSAGVWVQSGLVATVDGTALAAEITSRQAITTDLASTANAKGASLVGIEDSAGIITATTVEGALAEKLDGRRVANVADANIVGGIPVVHIVAIADGATGDTDVTLTHKTEVIDVVVVKTVAAGGASDTITVKNGATAITNAIDINIADKTIARAGTVDDASFDIAAAGTLRITRTKVSAANVACRVYVYGVRRA